MHIKFKGMERRIPHRQIYVLTHTLDTWGQVKGLKLFFLNVVMLHIEFKKRSNLYL